MSVQFKSRNVQKIEIIDLRFELHFEEIFKIELHSMKSKYELHNFE